MQNPGLPKNTYRRLARRGTGRFLATARFIVACAVAGNMLAGNAALGQTLDKLSFATNWVAEAEHGGFYQALADGTYRRYGLDVTICRWGRSIFT
jgi:NitT/TauT family transport system substrate-binding protein